LNEPIEAAERERLALEERARAEEAIDSYRARRAALERGLPVLEAAAGPARRLAAAFAGSRAWERLARPKRRPRRKAAAPDAAKPETAPPESAAAGGTAPRAAELQRERAAFFRLARRADALERGLGPRLGSVACRLARRDSIPRRTRARPALRRRELRNLLAEGGHPLRVSLEPQLASLAGSCEALGWQVGGDADVALTVEGDSLEADWLSSGDRFPARLRIDAPTAARDPGSLRDALSATLERPFIWIRIARQGGDERLARSLCRELAQLGHTALLQHGAEPDDEQGAGLDVAVAIQGRELPDPLPGQLSLVWQISHPDAVSAAELGAYDCVLVASPSEADRLSTLLPAPVEVMPQFTDPQVFFREPDESAAHELLFAGNWRGVFRRAVWDALSAGLEPALYGRGWSRLAPRHARAEEVSPDELRRLYSSCEILLADHWDDMRARGFVANRIYDALACEAFVISDRVAGLEAELGDVLDTYSGAAELRANVDHWLAHPDERRERARRGRELVLERHTAEHRARQLVEAIERLSRRSDAPAGVRSGGDSAPAP
jgi:glycosyltransferase involved in cell wall biosynthesis